jgi:hypothetical protein
VGGVTAVASMETDARKSPPWWRLLALVIEASDPDALCFLIRLSLVCQQEGASLLLTEQGLEAPRPWKYSLFWKYSRFWKRWGSEG